MDSAWVQQLPPELQNDIKAVVEKDQSSFAAFDNLHAFLTGGTTKKRKLNAEPEEIPPETIIFEINEISFYSPVRKRMNLTLHLVEEDGNPSPALSIVNPSNNIPELTFTGLDQAVKLCLLLPILGNTTNTQKKAICYLCFWMHDENMSKDPIVCQMNLDLVKKLMIKNGKLPADIESKFITPRDALPLNPIQERIIDYFKRQFQLCGISMMNYMPCVSIFRNTFSLNDDNAIAMNTDGASQPALVMVNCHKGAKEGVLILLQANKANPAHIIFGFKKPILVFEASQVLHTSYSNITRQTFSLNVVVLNKKQEQRELEFGMIDEKFYKVIDDFIKLQGINDATFNQEESGDDLIEIVHVNNNDDDDDEEDDDFQSEDSGSDVEEEYNSDLNEPLAAHEEEDGVFERGIEIE